MGAGRGKHASGMRLILNLWTPPYPPVNLFLIPVTRFLDSLVILHRYTYNSVVGPWLRDLIYHGRWMRDAGIIEVESSGIIEVY